MRKTKRGEREGRSERERGKEKKGGREGKRRGVKYLKPIHGAIIRVHQELCQTNDLAVGEREARKEREKKREREREGERETIFQPTHTHKYTQHHITPNQRR